MMPVEIELVLPEEIGVPREHEVTMCGVPLREGSLRDSSRLVIRDPHGTCRPIQVLREERWPDGSLRWIAVAFAADVAAATSSVWRLLEGDPASPVSHPARVHHDAGDVVLDNGLVSSRIGVGQFVPFFGLRGVKSCSVDARLGDDDVAAWIDELHVRHDGPLVACVDLVGHYRDAGGRRHAGLRAELMLTSGANFVDLAVAVVQDGDQPEVPLAAWSVRVGTAGVDDAYCGAFEQVYAGTPPFSVRHDGGGHPRGIFALSQVVGGTDWRELSEPTYRERWEWAELHGRPGQNWVVLDTSGATLTAAVERLCEQYPCQLSVGGSEVVAALRPDDVPPWPLRQGTAPRRRVRLVEGVDIYAGARLDNPLVPFVPSALGTGAVPRVLPYLPARYPRLEAHIREEMFGWYLWSQSLGFYNHGDGVQAITTGPRTGYSSNNEHDAILSLVLHYLRSGERAYLDSAVAYADHTVDIDLIHHSSYPHEVGGVRAHGYGHVHYVEARTSNGPVRTSIDTGHLWAEGLVLLGQVTGQRRYLDAAHTVADCILALETLGWTRPEPGPRNAGWPLVALAAVASATGETRYLDAAHRIADRAVARQRDDGRWLMRLGYLDDYCAWQNAVLLIGLARLDLLDPTPAIGTAFRRGARALIDAGRNPDGTFVYLTRYDYRWTHHSALVREALALAADATGDEAFITAGLAEGSRWYRPPRSGPASSEEIAEWRGHLQLLARAHEAGLLEDLPS